MAKILLVEDDNNLREIYEARLSAEGYEITTAQNGEEALSVAKQVHPDLVISDVMMPRISGFEMLDILRNTDELKHTKIIMLTALGQTEDRGRADNLGADKYLVKSQVTLEDIVKAAQALLGEGSDQETDSATTSAAPAVPATDNLATPVSSITAPASSETVASSHVTAGAPEETPVANSDDAGTADEPAETTPVPVVALATEPPEDAEPEQALPATDTTVVVADPDPITPATSSDEPTEDLDPPTEPAGEDDETSAPAPTVEVEPSATPEPVAESPSSAPVPTSLAPTEDEATVEAVEPVPTPVEPAPIPVDKSPSEPPVTESSAAPAPVNDLEAATKMGVLDSATAQTLKDEEAAIQSQIEAFEAEPVVATPAQAAPSTEIAPDVVTETTPAEEPTPLPQPEPSSEASRSNDAVLSDAIDKLTTPEEETAPTLPAEPVEEPVEDTSPTPAVDTLSEPDTALPTETPSQNISGHKQISPPEHSDSLDLDKLLAQEDAKEPVEPQAVVVDAEAAPEPATSSKPTIDPNSIAL